MNSILFPNAHLYCFKAHNVCFTNSGRREDHKLCLRLAFNILLFQSNLITKAIAEHPGYNKLID